MPDIAPNRFDILLKTVKALEGSEDGKPAITCTASSDEVDLGVDKFAISALQQMQKAFIGMTIFLNHKYAVPEDVFGTVTAARLVQRDYHTDLDLDIEVDEHNPRAQVTYNQIKSGRVLGISVGVMVEDADYIKENGQRVLEMRGVYTLEASVVGIPANRRSWVRGALKAASAHFTGEARAALDKLVESLHVSDGSKAMALEDTEDEVDQPFIVDEEIATPPEATVAEAPAAPAPAGESGDTTVVVVVVEDDDDDDMEMDEPAEPASEEQERRAETIAALREAYIDKDRKWFSIKEVTVETESQPETVAEVAIYDAIGSGITAQDFVAAISGITAARINLRINSPGGIIDDGIAIRNALARHPADVYTYVDGLAASMASVIALVGKEVIMEPDSMLMIHEPSGCQMGDTYAMAKEARILNKYGMNIASAYARKAGGTKEEWRDVMKDEGWYTAEEAVTAGLADRVGDSADPEMKHKSFDSRIMSLFKHTPEAATRFFKAEAPVPVTAAIVTAYVEPDATMAADVAALTKNIASITAALKTATDENESLKTKAAHDAKRINSTEGALVEVTGRINWIMDNAPLQRKTASEAKFDSLAERYPFLDASIIAQLSRDDAHETD